MRNNSCAVTADRIRLQSCRRLFLVSLAVTFAATFVPWPTSFPTVLVPLTVLSVAVFVPLFSLVVDRLGAGINGAFSGWTRKLMRSPEDRVALRNLSLSYDNFVVV